MNARDIFLSGLGGAVAISVAAWLTQTTAQPLLMAPFGASCFLMFVVPDNPVAQPRNVIGGSRRWWAWGC